MRSRRRRCLPEEEVPPEEEEQALPEEEQALPEGRTSRRTRWSTRRGQGTTSRRTRRARRPLLRQPSTSEVRRVSPSDRFLKQNARS
jgi:hypothetical protein